MSDLEIKGRHDVFTPRHETLVLKKAVATPSEPYLFAQSFRYFCLHKENSKLPFIYFDLVVDDFLELK